MKRKLNLKLLVCLFLVGAVLGVGGHFLHAYQVKRNAVELRQRAQRAADSGQLPDAIREYNRYLSLVHDDDGAWAEYALVLDKNVKTPRERAAILDTFEHALRLQGDRDDIRKRLVQVAMDLGLYSVAQEHLKKLLETAPHNAELLNLMGRCLAGATDYAGAAKQFAQAIEEDPTAIDNYVRLVDLWRNRLNKADQTQAKMDQMVQKNGTAAAHVARARYYRQGGAGQLGNHEGAGQPDTEKNVSLRRLGVDVVAALAGNGNSPDCWSAARSAFTGGPTRATFTDGDPDLLFKAGQDLAKATELAPNDADVLLESAELERSRGWLGLALRYARRGMDLYPNDLRTYKEVADLAALAGQRPEAIACLRQGVKTLPNETQLLFQLTTLLIQDGKLEEAKELMGSLEKQRTDPAILDYLEGYRKVAGEEWLAGSGKLESAYPGLARWPELGLGRQTALLLGKCYEQLGDPDQAYSAYRRILTEDVHDPLWFPAAEGVARSLLALNKVDDALDAYRRLIPRAPAARLIVVRLLIVQNMRVPEAQRRWTEVDRLLAELVQLLPKSADVPILQAQALAARSQYTEAEAILSTFKADGDGDIRISVARAGLADNEGKNDAAATILDDAEKQFGDHLELRAARIRHYLRTTDHKTALKELGKLEEGMDRFSAAEQLSLRRALAEGYAVLEAPESARRLWEQVADKKPNDLGVRIQLFDLALQTHDDAEAERQQAEIRRLEGERGTLWRYCAAVRLIDRAEHGDRTVLDDARSLLAAVAARRPAWHRVPVGEARIAELSGNVGEAIRDYLRAIELGERSTFVLLKTIQLLYDRQRYDEAYQVIGKLPEQTPLLQRINQVVIDLSLRTKDTGHALTLAKQAVADNPKDYHNHLALGRVYWALDKRADAKDSLRRSIELGGTASEPWVTLVQFLMQTKQDKDAEAVVQEMAEKLPLDKNRLAFAQCYLAIGKTDKEKDPNIKKAGDLYRAALATAPNDPATLRAATEFALRTGNSEEAEQFLRHIIDLKDQSRSDVTAAREVLALLTLAHGTGYQPTRDALHGLGFINPLAESLATESVEDKRARAVILALQPGRSDREDALRLLEEVANREPLPVSDQFLQAQLYRTLGQWPKARTQMLALLAKTEVNPTHIVYYARCLLERNEPDEAAPWIAKLETAYPDKWPTVELKARLLSAQKRGGDAADLLTKYAAGKDAPLAAIALLLDRLGQATAAEKVLDQLAAVSKKPETTFLRASFLSRHDRLPAALDLVETARSTSRSEVIGGVAIALLYQSDSMPADQKRVERWLEEGMRSVGNDKAAGAALQRDLAALYNLQGRFPDAEAIYRRCLEQDSSDVLAANNLAWLLATNGRNLSECLSLIQSAIERGGPKAGLLDTRAIVYLAMDKPDSAVKDMEEVVGDRPSASSYFHLARAQYASKNKQAARDALQQAMQLGLREKDLHPFERDKYGELCAAVGIK